MKKKERLKTECSICNKMFEDPRNFDSTEEYRILKVDKTSFCSEKCFKIYKECLANRKNKCAECGKKLNKKEEGCLLLDVKERAMIPMCNKCLYPED